MCISSFSKSDSNQVIIGRLVFYYSNNIIEINNNPNISVIENINDIVINWFPLNSEEIEDINTENINNIEINWLSSDSEEIEDMEEDFDMVCADYDNKIYYNIIKHPESNNLDVDISGCNIFESDIINNEIDKTYMYDAFSFDNQEKKTIHYFLHGRESFSVRHSNKSLEEIKNISKNLFNYKFNDKYLILLHQDNLIRYQ
jgi:hypothetical protein